jgi:hypothetical protein
MMRMTATYLRASGGMPRDWTMAVRARVKRVKLATKPVTTPRGLDLPPAAPPERTMGRTGRMQGESIVITPERKAKPRRINM